MTALREAAQQALEALEDACGAWCNAEYNPCWQREMAETLRAALAEPNRAQKLTEAGYTRRPTLREMAEPVQEPGQRPVAWLLQSELDELLACNHMGLGADSPTIWAPYDISTPSADMGLVPVYAAPPQRPAEPVQAKPVAWQAVGGSIWAHKTREDDRPLYTAPLQRNLPATIDELFARMDKAPRGVFSAHDPMAIWMEAWRAAEQHHGIK